MATLPVGVLISGQGSNLEAILQQCDQGTLAAEVRLVVSNRPSAPGLAYSRRRGIPTLLFPREDFANRAAQQAAVVAALEQAGVELVVLAGFDQILSDHFVQRFSGRLMNLHPSLLPAFGGGMHAVRDAFDHGAKITGCTVHFITSDLTATDSGPIIAQEAVPIHEDDDEGSLLARLHTVEHRLLPHAIQLFAQGRLVIEGRRVRVLASIPPSSQ